MKSGNSMIASSITFMLTIVKEIMNGLFLDALD